MLAMPDTAAFIERPPPDVAGWAALFQAEDLPVLAATAAEIETLRELEEHVDAHEIAESLGGDPLMTLKLLAHVAQMRRPGLSDDRRGEVETITEALVLLGIGPFFRTFGPQTTVADVLSGRDEAREGFDAVLRRSRRAANFALGFAAHRMDHDAAVLYAAALLPDFAELLLWLRAPSLALEIQRRQGQDSTLRSMVVQRDVLRIELGALQQALMKRWQLPTLLRRITCDTERADVQVRNVQLAVRLARHTAKGWDNPAVPDDVRDVAELLQLAETPTRRLLLDIDGED